LSVALVIIASVLIAAALPPSGGSDPTHTANSGAGAPLAKGEIPHVWVGGTAEDVYMIQVTRQGTSLSGTYDATWLATPTQPNSVHAAFSGVIDGTAITLTFPQGLGFVSNIAGTISTIGMTVQTPQADGSIATLTLKPSTVYDYNQRITSLQQAAAVNASASAATAARQQTQAYIDNTAGAVAKDITALQAANKTPDFSALDHDLTTANHDLAQTKTDATKAASETNPGDACYDASTTTYDASTVQYDSHSVDYDTNAINTAADTADRAVASLNADLTTYQQAAAAMPGYQAAYQPDPSAIQTLEDKATKAAAAWRTKATQYETQVASLLNQANTIAAQAQKQYC
jgi:hypothetical protein